MLVRKPAVVATALALPGLLLLASWLVLRHPSLMEVESPGSSPVRVGVAGVPLLVLFDPDGRAEASTFQVTLNGADVTGLLQVASNGAQGSLHALVDGENHLELRIFGRARAPFDGIWVEEVRDLRIDYRRPLDWDQG